MIVYVIRRRTGSYLPLARQNYINRSCAQDAEIYRYYSIHISSRRHSGYVYRCKCILQCVLLGNTACSLRRTTLNDFTNFWLTVISRTTISLMDFTYILYGHTRGKVIINCDYYILTTATGCSSAHAIPFNRVVDDLFSRGEYYLREYIYVTITINFFSFLCSLFFAPLNSP